jgi:16S rRNA (guanine966-N2)-methyltransferase
MKIIAGKYKNRTIPTSKDLDYRPSTTKFREALFSILSSGEFASNKPFKDANVLDLFAGSGSLSFEALSRGAKSITLIDNNSKHLEVAKEFAAKIGEEKNISFLLTSAVTLPYASRRYSLVFMDPPYYNDFIGKALVSLIKNKWLEKSAIIAVEMEKLAEVDLPIGVSVIKEKIYGKNKLLILKYEQE